MKFIGSQVSQFIVQNKTSENEQHKLSYY